MLSLSHTRTSGNPKLPPKNIFLLFLEKGFISYSEFSAFSLTFCSPFDPPLEAVVVAPTAAFLVVVVDVDVRHCAWNWL